MYDVLNEHAVAPDLAVIPPTPDTENNAVIEFHAATVAVREKVGKFSITVWRHGNLEPQARVRYCMTLYFSFTFCTILFSSLLM